MYTVGGQQCLWCGGLLYCCCSIRVLSGCRDRALARPPWGNYRLFSEQRPEGTVRAGRTPCRKLKARATSFRLPLLSHLLPVGLTRRKLPSIFFCCSSGYTYTLLSVITGAYILQLCMSLRFYSIMILGSIL